jgi:hypothetical protein
MRPSWALLATQCDQSTSILKLLWVRVRRSLLLRFRWQAPQPFLRDVCSPRVHLQRGCDGVSIYVDGLRFDQSGGLRRAVATDDGLQAQMWFGDRPWATIAMVETDGTLRGDPSPPPQLHQATVQQIDRRELPIALRVALAELCAHQVPQQLVPMFTNVATETPIIWGNTGLKSAQLHDTHIELHGAMWQEVSPLGSSRLVAAMADAVAPLFTQLLQRRLLRTLAGT